MKKPMAAKGKVMSSGQKTFLENIKAKSMPPGVKSKPAKKK